jgi:two-component system chemotaxis response regulator CheB
MVADDSVVVRGLISRWIEAAGYEVVASVANGRRAIEALDRVEPEIALLDLDMPELDGVSTLPRLLEKRPELLVVVISTLSQRNAAISLKCLSLGAVDYLPKPESNREVTTSTSFRSELVTRLHALARRAGRSPAPPLPARGAPPVAPPPAVPPPAAARMPPVNPRCLLIGASTGGPKAVGEVLSTLGPSLRRIPALVVQHMPPIFTAAFADHLSVQIGLPVKEAEHGEALTPGKVVVAPGGRHMGLSRAEGHAVVRLDDGPPVNFCRPAVDVLFQDAAAAFGASALAVVLTGMGADGLHGARKLVDAGATVLVQDEASSTVWGMPGSVAKAGLAHEILPLDAIAPAIRTYLSGGAA